MSKDETKIKKWSVYVLPAIEHEIELSDYIGAADGRNYGSDTAIEERGAVYIEWWHSQCMGADITLPMD